MKDTKKILANTIWMVFDKVFMLLLNLFVTVKVLNHFGATECGHYNYALSIVAVLELIIEFIDGRVVKKHYIENDPEEIVFTTTVVRGTLSILALFVGILYMLLKGINGTYLTMFIFLLINMSLTSFRFGMVNRFEYLLKSKKIVIAADIAGIVGAVLQLIAVKNDLPISYIAAVAAITSGVNLFIVWIQYRCEFRNITKTKINFVLAKKMLAESFPLALAASCSIIYTRCDSIMLGNMMPMSQVGIYGISLKLLSIVQIAISPIRESVYPKLIELYKNNKEEYSQMYMSVTSILSWVYIVGVSLSFFVLPYAFRVLKPEYSQAFRVYQINVLGVFFMYNSALRAGHFTLINRGSILTWSQLISVIVNIILNYFLINSYGMYGAALATTVTQFLSLLISNLLFGKDGRQVFLWQIRSLNPFRAIKSIKLVK